MNASTGRLVDRLHGLARVGWRKVDVEKYKQGLSQTAGMSPCCPAHLSV